MWGSGNLELGFFFFFSYECWVGFLFLIFAKINFSNSFNIQKRDKKIYILLGNATICLNLD